MAPPMSPSFSKYWGAPTTMSCQLTQDTQHHVLGSTRQWWWTYWSNQDIKFLSVLRFFESTSILASLTRPYSGPAQPGHSQKTTPAPPLPECAPPTGCCLCLRLSLTARPPRCGVLWVLPPPPSAGLSWSDSFPSPERSLGWWKKTKTRDARLLRQTTVVDEKQTRHNKSEHRFWDRQRYFLFRASSLKLEKMEWWCENEERWRDMKSRRERALFYPGSCWQGQGPGRGSFRSHRQLQMDRRHRYPCLTECHFSAPTVPYLEAKRGIKKSMPL